MVDIFAIHTDSTCLFPGNMVMVMSACSNKIKGLVILSLEVSDANTLGSGYAPTSFAASAAEETISAPSDRISSKGSCMTSNLTGSSVNLIVVVGYFANQGAAQVILLVRH